MVGLAGEEHPDASWRTVLREMLLGVRSAVLRFPAVALFLFTAMLHANLDISGLTLPAFLSGAHEFTIGLGGGAMAALAFALFGETHRLSSPVKAVGGLAAGAVVTALIAFPDTFHTLEWTLLLGLAGAILLAPVIGRGSAGSFWMFSARLFFAALLALLALLLFAGGISAILVSMNLLFGLDFADEIYEHVWAFTGLLAAPLFGLGQVPDRFDDEPGHDATGFMDRGMRALGDFVAAPLLIVYAVILHAYALKIVITGEVPEGQIGWLVFVYGLCVYGALLIINPFFDRARAPTRFLLRFWPLFQIVPLGLLAYAIAVRIDSYGVTADRYFLALFGAAAAAIVLIQIVPRMRGDTRWMALIPVLALIFGSFGPQGAVNFALTSQAERFLSLVKNKPLNDDQHAQALSALSILSTRDALSRVVPPNGSDDAVEENNFANVAKAWGLDPAHNIAGSRGRSFSRIGTLAAFRTGDYDTIVEGVALNANATDPETVTLPSGQEISFHTTVNELVVASGDKSVSFPATPDVFKEVLGRRSDRATPAVELSTNGRRIKILLDHIYFREIDDGDVPQLQSIAGSILINSAEWGGP